MDSKDAYTADAVALPRWAAIGPGKGGQPRLLIDAPAASAEIYLCGATITSYIPHGKAGGGSDRDLLFTSSRSIFDGVTGIRGGIPLCSPWFGVGISGHEEPKHGWVRTQQWSVRQVRELADGAVEVLLSLAREGLEYLFEVGVGRELSLRLSVRHTGSEQRCVEMAFHHYFAVGDVTAVRVRGLDGESFEDFVHGGVGCQEGELTFNGPIDRIYTCHRPLEIVDPAWGRRVRIESQDASHAIVWNPWSSGAAAMADMDDAEWPRFVCVESGLIRQCAPVLEQGESASMGVTISLASM